MSKGFNQFKTAILLGALTGLLLWVGQLLGGIQGLFIGLVFAIIMNFGSYWFSDKIVLAMYKAQPISKEDDKELYYLVKEVADKSDLPMPKLYVIPTDNANAFATGRNPEHAAVAVTRGILKILNKDELRGVIAHEMSHVKNRDILIGTIAATIAGVISYVAFMARFAAIFGGGRGRDSGQLFELLALAILTPLIATILQLAISRSREYLADATGASIIRDSKSLASALQKLETAGKHTPMKFGNKAASALFITNPFTAKSIFKLFSTHPPMEERVRRLNEMEF